MPVSAEWNESVKQAGQSTAEGLTALLRPNAEATLAQLQSDAGTGGIYRIAPLNYNDPDPATGLSIHDTRNLNAATSVLTPDQLQVYKNSELQIHRINRAQRWRQLPWMDSIRQLFEADRLGFSWSRRQP